MADDDVGVLVFLAEKNSGSLCAVEVAGSVEAVASDVELLIPLVRYCVHVCLGRHGLMESGVHDDCVRDVRHDLSGCLDSHDVGGHVERSEGDDGLQLLDDLVGHKRALLEDLAAVQDPMAYGTDLGDILDYSVSLVCDELYDELNGLFMCGAGELVLELVLACSLVLDCRVLKTDSLYDSHSQDVFLVPVIYLILGG